MHKQPAINKNILLIAGVIIIFLTIAIPWKNYVFSKNLREGKDLLADRKYTAAFVKFEKASTIKPTDGESKRLKTLAKDSSKDPSILVDFLKSENKRSQLNELEKAVAKLCDLIADRKLIEENKPDLARVNLIFCSENLASGYDAWTLLGVANLRLAESPDIFKEQKPGLRKEAKNDFGKAYEIDPINTVAIEYSIELNKILGDQGEVDRWQKLLDNLNKIKE